MKVLQHHDFFLYAAKRIHTVLEYIKFSNYKNAMKNAV